MRRQARPVRFMKVKASYDADDIPIVGARQRSISVVKRYNTLATAVSIREPNIYGPPSPLRFSRIKCREVLR